MLNYEYPPLGGGAGVIAKHIAEGLQAAGNGQIGIFNSTKLDWLKTL